jgi:hypothetical protein
VSGTQALALVRSRHLYYYENGTWNADVQSDFSRIQRQDVFFRAMITRAHQKVTDPLSINAFIGSISTDVTVSKNFKGMLLGLAEQFHSVGTNALKTETMPVTEFVNSSGEDVLQAAQPYASSMIQQLKAYGGTSSSHSSSSKTSTTVANSSIDVRVLNGDGTNGLAQTVSNELKNDGFSIAGSGDAGSFSFTTSEIQYSAGHENLATQLEASLTGTFKLVSNAALPANTVYLTVGSTFGGVKAPSSTSGTTGTSGTSGTSTPPSNVVTNTQTEPWNPTICS